MPGMPNILSYAPKNFSFEPKIHVNSRYTCAPEKTLSPVTFEDLRDCMSLLFNATIIL